MVCNSRIQQKAVLVSGEGRGGDTLQPQCWFVPARSICRLWGKCDVCWAEAPWAAPKRKLLLGLFLVSGSGMLLLCCPVTNQSQIHLVALFHFLSQATKGPFHRLGSWYTQLLLICSGAECATLFCNIFMQRRKSGWLCCVCNCESHHKLNSDAWKENTKCFLLF